jgi:predicted Rdx family selenoprotein
MPTRKHLGCIYDDQENKEKAFESILDNQKEIIKMNTRFCSFDNVAKMYEDIKPLRGKRSNEDVRPIWARRYHWRRVAKINDNKYVLHDGDYKVGRTFEESCDLAPITWERKADGDYMTVRNCHAPYYSMSRYAFLSNALPRTMWFSIDNGKHYIVQGDKEHYLHRYNRETNVNKVVITRKKKNGGFGKSSIIYYFPNEVENYKTADQIYLAYMEKVCEVNK